jgi:hypothetical protein
MHIVRSVISFSVMSYQCFACVAHLVSAFLCFVLFPFVEMAQALQAGQALAHGTTGSTRKVGATPPPPTHKNLQQNVKLCNIVTATSLLN